MKQIKRYYRTNTSHYARCRTLMIRFRHMHRIRNFLTSVILFSNCYFHVITLPMLYYQEYDRVYGLFWGSFAYVVNLIILITGFSTIADRLRQLILLLLLIAGATVIGFLHPYAGAALGWVYLTQIPESFKMRWIQRQQGYPYFNERYQRQEEDKQLAAELIEEAENAESAYRRRQPRIVVFSMPEEEE